MIDPNQKETLIIDSPETYQPESPPVDSSRSDDLTDDETKGITEALDSVSESLPVFATEYNPPNTPESYYEPNEWTP